MKLRRRIKHWFYGSCPGVAGSFPYHGVRVHFPKRSVLFDEFFSKGAFESSNLNLLYGLVRDGSHYFDVGTNIGLMSIPLLARKPNCRVVSFEPSPGVLPYLRRTMEDCPYRARWELVAKAVGPRTGNATFSVAAAENSPFDGLKDTGRVPSIQQVQVEMTTIDAEWDRLGRPEVSAIKCDVEGAELGVLEGATECLASQRPPVLLEWFLENLQAYECRPGALLDFSNRAGYRVLSLPNLVRVESEEELRLHMLHTESFLLCAR